MGYLVAAILFTIGAIYQKKDKSISAPETIFCYFWGVIVLLAAMELFGLYSISWRTYLIILVGSVAFAAGAQITRVCVIGNLKHVQSADSAAAVRESYIKPKTAWILLAIYGILIAQDFLSTLKLKSMGYSLGSIRAVYYGVYEVTGISLAGTSALEVLLRIIKRTLEVLLVPVAIEAYFLRLKKGTLYFILCTGILLLSAFADGGRWRLVYLVAELFVCYIIYRKKRFSKEEKMIFLKKNKFKLFLIAAVLVGLVVTITFRRGVEVEEFFRHLYVNACGCIGLLEVRLQEIETEGIVTYFFSGFHGFIPTLMKIWNGLFELPIPEVYRDTVGKVISSQGYYTIGDGIQINALVTCFFFLFADGRWLTLILGMGIWGLFSGTTYKNAIKYKRSTVPYLIFIRLIIQSLHFYPMTEVVSAVSVLLIALLALVRKMRFFRS